MKVFTENLHERRTRSTMKQWKKRVVSLVLACVMLVAMIPAGIFTASALNYAKSEFIIANNSDWEAISGYAASNPDATFAGKTIKFSKDFDANGATLTTLFPHKFAGTLDGQGFTVSNFSAVNALIATTTSAGAVIKALNIQGSIVRKDGQDVECAAMLAKSHDGTGSLTVSNVSVAGSVTGAGMHTAGLVAVLTLNDGMSASIENVTVSATVNDIRGSAAGAPTNGCVSAAGIVGVFEPMGKATFTVKNANVSGSVSAKTKSVGGVIGSVFTSDSNEDLYAGGTITVSNAAVTGTLSSGVVNVGTGVGGIVGTFGGFKRDFGEVCAFDGELNIDNCVVAGSLGKTQPTAEPLSVGGILGAISYSHATVNVEHCLVKASFLNSMTATNGTGAGLILGMAACFTMSSLNVNNTTTTIANAPMIGAAIARPSATTIYLTFNGKNLGSAATPNAFKSWNYTNAITDHSVLTVSDAVADSMVKLDNNGFVKRVGGQITALAVQDNVTDGATLTAADTYAIRFIGVSQVENIASASMEVIVRDAATGTAFKRYDANCHLYDALNAYSVGGAKLAYYKASDFGAKKFLALTIGEIPGGTAYTFDFTPSYVTDRGIRVTAETISISYDANGQYVKEMESFDVDELVLAPTVRVMSSNILNTDNSASAPSIGNFTHEQRLANMAEMFMVYQPDFIGLQEVLGHNVINHTATINMQETLLNAMSSKYAFVDFTNKVAVTAHWTPIMYLKDKWTVIEKDISDEQGVEYANQMHRWQWAVFQSKENPEWKFILLNLHGPNNNEGASYAEFQPTFFASVNAQLKMLEQKYPDVAISVTGDFNQPGSDTKGMLATMTNGTKLVNTPSMTENHEYYSAMIDHIFLSKNLGKVQQWRQLVNDTLSQSSDHYSVFADILLKKPVSDTVGSWMGWGEGAVMESTYKINSNSTNIKILGERVLASNETLYTDWTASGLEFVAKISEKSDIVFQASSTAPCYFKAYVDGALWVNGSSEYYTVNGDTKIVLTDVPAGTHTVRLVKATGYLLACAEIRQIELCGSISATADKNLYIEFLGDSISCGWGVIGDHDGGYASQDGTLAYPYLVAEALGADYSILGLSGRGVIYGSDYNFDKNYLNASPARSTAEYGFERKADIVVINLGTNERGNHADATEFEAGYVRLLENVFAKNGSDCIVYCLWGAMNDTYNTQIQNAIATYKASNPSANINTLVLATSTVAGGAPSWGHPSISDHAGYTTALTAELQNAIS